MQLLHLYVGPLLGASSPERATRNTTVAATRSKLLVRAQLKAEQTTALIIAATLKVHNLKQQLFSSWTTAVSDGVDIRGGVHNRRTPHHQWAKWFSLQISGSGLVPPRVGVQTAALLALRSAAEAAELPLLSCNITSWQLASSADARR